MLLAMSKDNANNHDGRRQAEPGPNVALLLIDVINDLAFDGGEALRKQALPMAHVITSLKRRAKAAGIPVIYVNDNYGHWQSDFQTVVEYCMRPEAPGRETTGLLRPEEDDDFVIKPRHSGFYQTNLELLLKYLKVRTLILTGMAADMCVLFTANDAYLRECRENARGVAARCGWQRVDCTRDGQMRGIEDIHEEVYARVKALLG